MQIEAQARVSDRVNQDPSDTHLPATAWPRQMFAAVCATQNRLVALAHRSVAVIAARPQRAKPSTGNGGQKYGRFLALSWNPSRYTGMGSPRPSQGYPQSWWCRLGRKDLICESGVQGREPPDGEITEQVISQVCS